MLHKTKTPRLKWFWLIYRMATAKELEIMPHRAILREPKDSMKLLPWTHRLIANAKAVISGPQCKECKANKPCKKFRPCQKSGYTLAKFSGRVWWIEYDDHDKRLRRERIGPNKAAAEQRYREVMSAKTEGRFIKKSPDSRTLFKDLAAWYLELPEVKAKRSYDRDRQSLNRLLPFFGTDC